MNIQNMIYFDFYSIGALNIVVFSIILAAYFISIKGKTKATFHIGMGFVYLMIYHLSFFVSFSVYNSLSAYHLWIVVPFVLLSAAHMNVFMFNYPDEGNPLVSKVFLIVQYIIIIIAAVQFDVSTYKSAIKFDFFSHYFNFINDEAARNLGLLIISVDILFPLLFIWKVIIEKKKRRTWLLLFGISFIISSGAPAILFSLSSDGLVMRDTYEIFKNMLHIIGFFIAAIIFINNSRDKTTFMAKIVGISIIILLIAMQWISYFVIQYQDSSYDRIYNNITIRAVESDHRPSDLEYLYSYNIKEDRFTENFKKENVSVDIRSQKQELLNTVLYDKMALLPDKDYLINLKKLMDPSNSYFTGYRQDILGFAGISGASGSNRSRQVMEHIDDIRKLVVYQSNKIRKISDSDFRNSLITLLKKADTRLSLFNNGITTAISANKNEGSMLRNDVLKFHTPLQSAGTRYYRENMDEKAHYTAFRCIGKDKDIIYEAGFSYIGYREYIHPMAKKLIFIILAMVFFIVTCSPLFFMGTLIKPLNRLVEGASNVINGDLDFNLKIKVEDEIGSLTHSFNKMVRTIKTGKEQIKDYTDNLEIKVRERTDELAKANTEIIEQQNKIVASERLAAIGELASSIAHEIRNPLGSIKNAHYYIKTEIHNLKPDDLELNQFIDIMENEINRCNKIITDLLDYSRNIKLTFTYIKIADLIQNTLSSLEIPLNIKIINNFIDNVSEIEIDKNQIQLVLTNIIQNAMQSINDAGEIQISLKDKINSVEIIIKDNGTGIPSDIKEKIFEPLFTTKNTGTGLGLSICKRIVTAHNGQLLLESKVGEGTLFNIILPKKQIGRKSWIKELIF